MSDAQDNAESVDEEMIDSDLLERIDEDGDQIQGAKD